MKLSPDPMHSSWVGMTVSKQAEQIHEDITRLFLDLNSIQNWIRVTEMELTIATGYTSALERQPNISPTAGSYVVNTSSLPHLLITPALALHVAKDFT
jgi:hypothetical protein